MTRKTLVLLLALATCLTTASAATVTTYNNKAAFDAALSNLQLIDFDDLTTSSADYSTSSGLTAGDVNFLGLNDPSVPNYFLMAYRGSGTYNWGSQTTLRLPYYFSTSYQQVTFATPVTAAGFDAMTAVTTGGTFVITFTDDMNVAPIQVATSTTVGNRTWIGFTSDTPFTSFKIHTLGRGPTGPQGMIDNFEAGAAGETPEIATILMLGFGLIALRMAGRRLQTPA
jgi:hypothetical protein